FSIFSLKAMRIMLVVAIAAGIVGAAVLSMVASATPTKDYSLSVDALKDKQSLFINVRVVITNNGKMPLTNILVDYGGKHEPLIPVLNPGEQRTLSPPEGVQLDSVTVTAD